jgi:hypothetical protein
MIKLLKAFRNFANASKIQKDAHFGKLSDFRGPGLRNVTFHSLLNAAASWVPLN